MKMSSRFLYTIYFLLPVSLLISSCKKFVQVPPPDNLAVGSTVFSNDQTATSSVVGLYSKMTESNLFFINGAMTLYPGLTSDEIYNTAPSTAIDPFTNNALASGSTLIQTNIWRQGYNYIYHSNDCIEGLAKSTGVSESIKQRLTGEVKFTRALCYFYLVNLFSDVPLITTTDYEANAVKPRAPVAEIYQQIIADLQDAQNLLSATYPTTGPVRPNKWAAAALLARVHLYQQNWINAEATATSVINSGSYSLPANLTKVFQPNSTEAIWQLIPVNPLYNTAVGNTFIPSSATVKPAYALTSTLLLAFEPNDQRKTTWLKSNTIAAQPYYYPYKDTSRTRASGANATVYNTVLRLAEQYLIRAEARARQNNITGAVADLNLIRQRAGLPALPDTITQEACLTAIAKENRIEFFAEWGHRWFDLKRTGQADAVLSVIKAPNWQSTDALFPIPSIEIQRNPFLTQNEGYQ
jgi:starch-binding outer membrane protein, SusD/RagB family